MENTLLLSTVFRVSQILGFSDVVLNSMKFKKNRQKISLVLNTTETPQAIKDSKSIRRSALESETPYYTTVSGANAAVMAIKAMKNNEMSIKTIQSFGQSLS